MLSVRRRVAHGSELPPMRLSEELDDRPEERAAWRFWLIWRSSMDGESSQAWFRSARDRAVFVSWLTLVCHPSGVDVLVASGEETGASLERGY